MASVAKGSLFPVELVSEVFSKVNGHSSIAKLANQIPVAFSGNEIMTFSLDNDVSIVAEGGQKPAGDATMSAVTIQPIKVVYQARVNDEFVHCAEEKRLSYLQAFTDGFAKKIARGLDIMALHGLDPKTLTASQLIGTNSLDTNTSVGTETYSSGSEEADITAAIADIGDYDCTGIAMSKVFASALANTTLSGGQRPYEDLMWGGNPGAIRGIPADVNSTVSSKASSDTVVKYAYVGDFANAFKWGYAENVPMEVIEYGDPDGAGDLKRLNQVLLRCEAYIGWGILDPTAFSRIVSA